MIKLNKKEIKLIKDHKVFYSSKGWRTLRKMIKKLLPNICGKCKKEVYGKNLHIDHIKSRYYNPKLALQLSNLQILCEKCNISKKSKTKSYLTETEYKILKQKEKESYKKLISLRNGGKLFINDYIGTAHKRLTQEYTEEEKLNYKECEEKRIKERKKNLKERKKIRNKQNRLNKKQARENQKRDLLLELGKQAHKNYEY